MFTGKAILGGVDLYDEYGITAVNVNQSMMESHFGITQNVIEEKYNSIDVPYFYGVERQPFQFTLTFARERDWDYKTKESFARLIFKPYYQNLVSDQTPQVIYKVICVDNPLKLTNGLERGYITLNFRTNAPWAYSSITTRTVEVTEAPYTFELENNSNILEYYYPELEFTTVGTEFRMTNNREPEKEFVFTELLDGEVVYVDNSMKRVRSDSPYPFNYRLSNFNRNWLRLKYGVNDITISTPCTITFKMQYPIAI